MNISYIDHGVTASLTLTSWLPQMSGRKRWMECLNLNLVCWLTNSIR